MPYNTIEDLPSKVREHLPEHAQEIYKEAFNHAWQEYRDPSNRRGDESLEEVSHKVAWSAVKKQYDKYGTSSTWVPKTGKW